MLYPLIQSTKLPLSSLVWLLLFVVTACTPKERFSPPNEDAVSISREKAEQIALNYPLFTASGRNDSGLRKVKNTLTFTDSSDSKPLLHIVNYTEGGYAIISGDKRLPEVLAIVEEGPNFSKTELIPDALSSWINVQARNVKEVKKTKFSIGPGNSGRMLAYQPGPSVSPLISTNWGQGCGFNAQTPICSSGGQCGHTVTGCVATAMAQVLRKWAYPASMYHWSQMPDNGSNSEVGFLMNYCGYTVDMTYGCVSSSAFASRIDNALRNNFNYSAAISRYNNTSVTDYLPVVISDLDAGRPVILFGSTNAVDILGFKIGTGDGHCWVADGYYSRVDPTAIYDPRSNRYFARTDYYLHMNWGWDGSHNGYFAATDWGKDVNGVTMPQNYGNAIGLINGIHPN